jgi:hypothetical protein
MEEAGKMEKDAGHIVSEPIGIITWDTHFEALSQVLDDTPPVPQEHMYTNEEHRDTGMVWSPLCTRPL